MTRFSALAAVLVFAAACDSTVQEPLVEQQQPVDVKPMVVMDLTGVVYTLPPAKTYPIGTSASATIDEEGGYVKLGDFAMLKVPADAVEDETVFTITVVKNGFVELDLKAYRYSDGKYVEVGALGFGEPVYLYVNASYAKLDAQGTSSSQTDGSNLTMLWEINGTLSGTFQVVPSYGSGGWVVSSLDHFSKYVLASN